MTTVDTRQHVSDAKEHCLWSFGGQDGLGEGTTEEGQWAQGQVGIYLSWHSFLEPGQPGKTHVLPSFRAAFLMVGAGICCQFCGAEDQCFSQRFLLCLSEALGRGPTWSPKRIWTLHSSSRMRVSGTGKLAEMASPCALPHYVINPQPTWSEAGRGHH